MMVTRTGAPAKVFAASMPPKPQPTMTTCGRGSVTRAHQVPAVEEHHESPREKAEIPPDPLRCGHGLVDMMYSEQLMVDDALDRVEEAEAEQQCADEVTRAPLDVLCARTMPQHG